MMRTGLVVCCVLALVLVLSATIKGQIYDYGLDRQIYHKPIKQYKGPLYVFPWLPIYSQSLLRRIKNKYKRKRKPTPAAKSNVKHSLCSGCCNNPPCWYRHAILCTKCYKRS